MENPIYQVHLNRNDKDLPSYEKGGLNLLKLFAKLPSGSIVSDFNYTVKIDISVDGMLGLGIELIRIAIGMKTHQRVGISDELMPIGPSSACQGEIGVFLTYNSSRFVLWDQNDIGNYLEQIKLSKKNINNKSSTWEKREFKKQNNLFYENSTTPSFFNINLNPKFEETQIYEVNDENLMDISVKSPEGKIITGYDCVVCIGISQDGMLGFGTELVRKALQMRAAGKKEAKEIERLEPIGPMGGSSGNLGVYLTHDSCNLELSIKDLGTVDQQLAIAEAKYKEIK